jgi:hypothetical protein
MSEWEINNPEFSGHFESFMLFVMVILNLILLSFLTVPSYKIYHDEYVRNHNFRNPLNPQANVTTYSAESDIVKS